jgi:hypothetical protein
MPVVSGRVFFDGIVLLPNALVSSDLRLPSEGRQLDEGRRDRGCGEGQDEGEVPQDH